MAAARKRRQRDARELRPGAPAHSHAQRDRQTPAHPPMRPDRRFRTRVHQTADSVLGFSRRNCRAEHIQNNLYGAPIAAFARGFLESRAREQWCSRACGVVNPLPILVLSAGSGLCPTSVTRGPASRRGTTLTCPGEPADRSIPHDAPISRCRARPPITMLEAIEVMSRPRLPVSTRPRNAPPPARTSCQLAEATKTATTNTA